MLLCLLLLVKILFSIPILHNNTFFLLNSKALTTGVIISPVHNNTVGR